MGNPLRRTFADAECILADARTARMMRQVRKTEKWGLKLWTMVVAEEELSEKPKIASSKSRSKDRELPKD